MKKSCLCVSVVLFAVLLYGCVSITASKSREISVSFANAQWNKADWTMVKTWRSPHIGAWIQNADHIQNSVPDGMTKDKMQSSLETYTSMLWNEKITGDFSVSSTMEFDYKMAPLIVIADKLGENADGYPEYRQHWEIVVWNEGINIWHHTFVDGKQKWHLVNKIKTPLEPNTKYTLVTEVRQQQVGAEITVICNNAKYSYIEEDFPKTVQVGITGCEGINRFYDFKLKQF